MGNQKWALWQSLKHCASYLWVCPLPFKSTTLGATCIDKTHEYLSGAIYHFDPTYTEAIFSSFLFLCQCSVLSPCTHIYPNTVTSSLLCGRPRPLYHLSCIFSLLCLLLSFISSYLFVDPIGKWRTRCRCSVSSSARPSASLTSAWPLWSCPRMFWGTFLVTSYYHHISAPF